MAGALTLERLQAGLEATRFTAVPATRKVYAERGNAVWEEVIGREFLQENAGSYIDTYRNVTVSSMVKITVPFFVSAADLAWWGQLAWKGSVAATGPTNATVYTYTFTPDPTTDTLKFATFEGYSDTQSYKFAGGYVDQLQITWAGGQSVRGTATILAQQAVASNVTPSIGDRPTGSVLNGINVLAGTTAKVYIDNGGGTIGATQALNVLSGQITWANNGTQITHLIGNLFPDEVQRLARHAALDLDIHYSTDTERVALLADTERLIRVVFTGPTILGSTPVVTPETITMDFYGYWQTQAFAASGAIRTLKMSGVSQYDTTAMKDWCVTIANSLATLP